MFISPNDSTGGYCKEFRLTDGSKNVNCGKIPNCGSVYSPLSWPAFGSPRGDDLMHHISCDYCGNELSSPSDAHYTLRMEARLVCDSPGLNDDTRDDHEPLDPVDAMEDWLSEAEITLDETTPINFPIASLDKIYDLCTDCYRRIQADPLGLDRARRFQLNDQ